MQVPEIIDAHTRHEEALASVLTEAFSEDPVMNWLIPEPQLYGDFFRLLLRDLDEGDAPAVHAAHLGRPLREFDRGEAATILVSERVASAVGEDLAVAPVGDYEVKGRSEPVKAFRLLSD